MTLHGFAGRYGLPGLLILMVACFGSPLHAEAQPEDLVREEILKRASGLGHTGEAPPPPPSQPEAPRVSPTPAAEATDATPAAEGEQKEPVVTRAYLDAYVRSGDLPTTRPVVAPPKRSLSGKILKLNAPIEGEIYIPDGWNAVDGAIDAVVHFHGAPWVVQQEFDNAKLDAVLIALNPGGRGTQYSSAFSNPDVFDYILDVALQQVRREDGASPSARWGRLALSSFSAGYGAIREILFVAAHFNQIEALALADSLHAAILETEDQKADPRALDENQMRPFVEFARLAAEGKKTFVLSRSSILPLYYSGTPETAAYIVRALEGRERRVEPPRKDATAMTLIAQFEKGNFRMQGYAGAGAADHMAHFHNLSALFAQLPFRKRH